MVTMSYEKIETCTIVRYKEYIHIYYTVAFI